MPIAKKPRRQARRIREAHTRASLDMTKIEEAILARYQEPIESAKRGWQAVRDGIVGQIAAYENEYKPLWKAIWKEMAAGGPRSWSCPQPVEADEIPNPLFDSGREYEEQLEAYKTFQRKHRD